MSTATTLRPVGIIRSEGRWLYALSEAGIIEEDDEVYHSQVGGTIDSLGMMQKLEKMYQGQKELRKELMDTRDMVKKLQKMSTFGGKTVGDGMS